MPVNAEVRIQNRAGKVNTPLLCLDSPCSDVVRCRVDCYNNQAICIGDALDCDDELPISNIVIGSWYGMLLQDEGDVLSLNYEKKRLDTGLKLYYSGNLRAGRQCEHCCARWFFVIDTMECSNPGSIEFQEYHVHKRTHQMHGEFGGVCEDVSPGLHKIILRIGPCVGHELGDQLTGWNSQYFIRIEEVDLRSKTALCPSWTVFNIKQYTSLISNTIDQDNAVLMSFNYTKRASDTALRVTWNGMLGQYSVGNMCNRWYFTFNGQECSDPDTISTIVAFLAGSTNWGRRSYTLDGLCKGLGSGNILIEFRIGFCEDGSTPGDAYTGHSAGESIPLAKVLVEETRLGQDINAVLKPDGRVVQLPVFNRQYWSWRQTISTNSQTVLKSFTYFKRSKTSSLHVVYTFVGKIQGEHRCARWFIMFNGTECTRPGRIEHTSYQGQLLYGDTVWHIPSVCDGTCHGLPMGTVEVGILVTVCDMHPNMAVSCTGWNAKQSLMVEETYLQT